MVTIVNESYFSLTFYGQNRLIVNTNAVGFTRFNLHALVTTILGPFKEPDASTRDPEAAAIILEHHGAPFGSVRLGHERETVAVHLTALFEEVYKQGWKAVGNSVFDPMKRRGCVIFKMSGEPASTPFACFSINSVHTGAFMSIVPAEFEERIHQNIRAHLSAVKTRHTQLGAPYTRRRRFRIGSRTQTLVGKWKNTYTISKIVVSTHDVNLIFTAQSFHLDNYIHSFSTETASVSMGAVLQVVSAMGDIGFRLEASVGVFGPGTHSLLFFGYHAGEENVLQGPVWGMTVMNPKKVVLVDAPQEAWTSIKEETENWRQFGARDMWGRRDEFAIGKMAFVKLLTRLAVDNWVPLNTYDGLYKNSFFIFQKSDKPYLYLEANPKIAIFSEVSDKKMKVDDVSMPSPYDRVVPITDEMTDESARILGALDTSIIRPKRCPFNSKIRIFENCQFAYYMPQSVAKQMYIYLVLQREMEQLGYGLFCTGNISGRFNLDTDTRGISPHSWIFIKNPEAPGAPIPSYSTAALMPPVVHLSPNEDTRYRSEDEGSLLRVPCLATSGLALSSLDDEGEGLPTYEEAIWLLDHPPPSSSDAVGKENPAISSSPGPPTDSSGAGAGGGAATTSGVGTATATMSDSHDEERPTAEP